MQKGDIVICTISGDYGKPRPAVIVQSNLFNPTHSSIVICPITSHLIDAPLFRLFIAASEANGLFADSHIMVDKLIAIKREKISGKIGHLSQKEKILLHDSLKLWLDLN